MRYAWTIPAILALACGGSGGNPNDFVEACMTSSNLDRSVCRCMAAKAERDLGDEERAFVLATLRHDEVRTAELRGRLGVEGAMRAGMFMTNVAECAVEGEGS